MFELPPQMMLMAGPGVGCRFDRAKNDLDRIRGHWADMLSAAGSLAGSVRAYGPTGCFGAAALCRLGAFEDCRWIFRTLHLL